MYVSWEWSIKTRIYWQHEGFQRGIEIVFNQRDHSFSSSSLRKRVAWAESQRLLKNEPAEPDIKIPEYLEDPLKDIRIK
jgi:hypothetical protein